MVVRRHGPGIVLVVGSKNNLPDIPALNIVDGNRLDKSTEPLSGDTT
jgi:hypothetical protein